MKTYKYIFGAILSVAMFSACEDKLNELPTQQKVDGNLVVDAKSAEVALNGVYYQYAMCGKDYYDVECTKQTSNAEVYPSNFAGVTVYYQGEYMLEQHPGYYASMIGSYFWTPYYSVVNAANATIANVEPMSEKVFAGNRKNEILGEAYCMRALAHYNLLHWFGYFWDENSRYGLVLRDEPALATKVSKERSSVKETFDFILKDLDFAIQNAPATNEKHYVTSWVAKGLKARVLMMRGQYSEAAAICQDIIQNSPYQLEDNVFDIFRVKGLASNEVMFGIQPKEGQTTAYEAYCYRNEDQWYPTKNFVALFDGDPRQDMVCYNHRIDDTMYQLYLLYFGIDDPSMIVEAWSLGKHLWEDIKTASTVEETGFEMRLTEFYLMRAEALAYQGYNEESKDLLRTVLQHAGVTDFSANVDKAVDQHSLIREVFRETLRNLYCESGRELDIMMRVPEDIRLEFNPSYADPQFSVIAIPADEFDYNNAFTKEDQNPGYSAD